MEWTSIKVLSLIVLGIYILGILAFFLLSGKKSLGLGQFSRTPQQVEDHVSMRIAPAPFYYKQRTF